MEGMRLRLSMILPPTTPHLRWSILAADHGVVVIAGITGIAGGAREVTLRVAGTGKIQPGYAQVAAI
jgi:hypothetical protein